MARFIYRMQGILDVKYKLEEQAKQHYMEVQRRLDDAFDERDRLIARKEDYFLEYRELLEKKLQLLEIETCKNAIVLMDQYIADQKLKIQQIEAELERAITALNAARKERKIYEKLRENQFERFLQELKEEEGKEIDQLISYQYNHSDEKED